MKRLKFFSKYEGNYIYSDSNNDLLYNDGKYWIKANNIGKMLSLLNSRKPLTTTTMPAKKVIEVLPHKATKIIDLDAIEASLVRYIRPLTFWEITARDIREIGIKAIFNRDIVNMVFRNAYTDTSIHGRY